MPTANFAVEWDGAFHLRLTGEEPTPWASLSGAAISWFGEVGEYTLNFIASGLQFTPFPRGVVPLANGIVATVEASASELVISIDIEAAPTSPVTRNFTIDTSLGPFDPSIAIDPPGGADDPKEPR